MSLYDSQHIRAFYNEYAEQESFRWEKSGIQQVKLALHQHYLREHIRKGDAVLELGAGTGVFTELLASLELSSLLVSDLSEVQLQLNLERAEKNNYAEKIEEWKRLDICDLSTLRDQRFDKVICYGGPLSYVFDQKRTALREIHSVLKPGGRVLLSVMNLWGTVREYLSKIVLAIPKEENEKILATGNLHPSAFAPSEHYCHMFTAEELTSDIAATGFRLLQLTASNCLAPANEEELEGIRRDRKKWEYLIEMEIKAARSPGMVESGTHMIAVLEK